MLKTAEDIEVGDVVLQETFGGERRLVTITAVLDDVKNGRKGFDGVTENGESVWGYCYQIAQIVSTGKEKA